MGKTKVRAWRGDTPKNRDAKRTRTRWEYPKQKTFGTGIRKSHQDWSLDYDDSDNEECELVESVSPMLDSLLDDDDGDVKLLDPKQEECELVENVSPVSDSIGKNMGKTKERASRNTDTPKKKLKQTQKLLDDNDGDVELLDPKQEECELVENVSPMSDSLRKFSSPQSDIICVQDYKVKRSTALILEAIFRKHGDIAAECVFKTDSVRSSILEVVCEVVRRIQTNDVIDKMEEIECQVADAEAANINVSWIRAHFEAIHRRKEVGKKYNLLMEMKANTSLAKRAAQMDLRESCAELVVAQQQFKKAERCVRVLHFVEKNLNDNIVESKAKIDSWVNHPVV